ncbi:DNA replication/repair protein RecF [Pseudenhygromyxa sp. WMMC2535]|uniref:DNA replication/repair protein RecF n=1 Tax=Pseudenhygromyxa sp. WMMC2535 TaxID=2712867 RepID=UPI001556058F|nr:DNA replication/repair protein RecF [Pseudenhygromyxa sp. WMMC2535]NVB38142.1 DNA replication/repair protein RecF [Pseudenhygromyxa sp. WMMC2535]
MELRRLSLSDFRNFGLADEGGEAGGGIEVEFGPRFTILWGHNGAGKTNVLEALYFVSTLRSFRGAKLDAMLRRGQDHARVAVDVFDPELGLPTQLELRIDRGARSTRRSARLDGKLIRSAAEFYGRIRAVLFTPEDLGILRGSPSARRQFLDRVLFARARGHIADVQRYDKLLRSRNRVLRAEPGELAPAQREAMLDGYDHGLADVGSRIWARRVALVDDLRGPFQAAFAQIHDRDEPDSNFEAGLAYRGRLEDALGGEDQPDEAAQRRRVALGEALRNYRRRDLAAGRTTVGPHLDDLQVTLDGAEASDFASQGQSRALVLAFKIAELRRARELRGSAPLLLLDDVSSELDPVRSARLFEALATEVGQCVLTTTSARYIELGEGVERRDLQVEGGRIRPAERAPGPTGA